MFSVLSILQRNFFRKAELQRKDISQRSPLTSMQMCYWFSEKNPEAYLVTRRHAFTSRTQSIRFLLLLTVSTDIKMHRDNLIDGNGGSIRFLSPGFSGKMATVNYFVCRRLGKTPTMSQCVVHQWDMCNLAQQRLLCSRERYMRAFRGILRIKSPRVSYRKI